MAEILRSLVQQLAHEVLPLVENVKMLRGVRDDVEQIRRDFVMLLAFLEDADKRQSSDQFAKAWVEQVRDIACDTEDVMDEVVSRFGQSPARGSWVRFLRQIITRYTIADRILRIRHCIRDIRDIWMRQHHLSLALTSRHGTGDEAMFGLRMENSVHVDYQERMYRFTQRLIQGERRHEVIAVVGMGGVGKTALASEIYKDDNVKWRFESRAWITVPDPFNTTELLRRIHRQYFSQSSFKKSSIGELAKELRDYLKERRYVAFLDGVWTKDTWDILKSMFPDDEDGRIVVTTQSRNVAAYCAKSATNIIRLEPLTEEDAWSLFRRNAFSSDDHITPELEKISRKILTKCAGLPLAIVAIGRLLSTKDRTPGEWEMVNRRLVSELDGSHVMKVISLSYDHLSFHLKPCFLYLGIYPYSHEIKRAEISRQWVSEGFIVPLRDTLSTPEDVCESYLNELDEKCLLEKIKLDCFGRVESFQVHGLVREFILLKSQEQSFYTWSGLQGDARRLAIYSGPNFEGDASYNPSQFRTLFLFGPNDTPSLAKFHSLKVLVLKGVQLVSFPSSILDLIHLRYLCLRRTKIATVPNSIKKLQNLQTLDLKYTPVSKLPHEIIQLRSLRHLLVGDASGPGGAKLPGKLGNLRSMHTLRFLDVGDGGEQLEELGKLTQLRRLSITSARKEDGIDLCSSITKMVHLQSLAVNSGDLVKLPDIDSLSNPPIFLRNIKLTGLLVKLPRQLRSLDSLVKLQLRHSQLKEDPFQALQFLPCLADLRMFDEAYAGEELKAGRGGFPTLKMLQIGSFHNLELITLEEGTMPNLQFLAIRGCKELRRIPMGIEHLRSLEEIHFPSVLLGIVLDKHISKKENKASEKKISEMEKEALEAKVRLELFDFVVEKEIEEVLEEEEDEWLKLPEEDEWSKLQRIPYIRQNFCVDGTWYFTDAK